MARYAGALNGDAQREGEPLAKPARFAPRLLLALLAAFNIKRCRYLDFVLACKVALVHGEAQSSTRVNVEERPPYRFGK